jgi:uncharacterized protein with PQ loop repeat
MNISLETILGVTYNICFVSCVWPQIIKSIKTKSVADVSIMLYYLSIIGYFAAFSYALLKFGFDLLLCGNYILSAISVCVMIYVYHKYKTTTNIE